MASYPPNWTFSVFSFLGLILVMIPLPWHLQGTSLGFVNCSCSKADGLLAWNIGTCAYMLWTAIGSLNVFVNSIVWNDSLRNVAPAWCDLCKLAKLCTMATKFLHSLVSHPYHDGYKHGDPCFSLVHQSSLILHCHL